MYEKELNELVTISQFAGKRIDYTQGGGGNTSVKLDNRLMAIKASGYKLSQITTNDAYVTVNYDDILKFYQSVDLNEKKDYETISNEVVKNSIELLDGMKELRPSVEAGFHSVLDKYVLHVHSVYAAIIVCAKSGKQIMDKLLSGKDYGFIFVPYINPGFALAKNIYDSIGLYKAKYGKTPQVIFMKNHGLVVHDNDCKRAMNILKDVNDTIKAHFDISFEEFKEIKLGKEGDCLISETPAVTEFLKNNDIDNSFFDKYPLYPDQLVYLNANFRLTPDRIIIKDQKVYYKNVSLKEVITLEETLAAYLFVMSKLIKHNLEISLMSKKDVNFINNWEAEKYRRSLNNTKSN